MVYYREGYVPQVYDQQVSTHLPAPETTSWPLPRELQIIPGAATLAGVGSVLPGVTESIGKLSLQRAGGWPCSKKNGWLSSPGVDPLVQH